MIGYLRGRVIDTSRTGHVLVDVNGVGYDVTVGKSSEAQVGSEVVYFIYTSVRPDAIVLFGFNSSEERTIFELLIETPGVGPSTALGALRAMPAAMLEAAIRAGDQKLISTIPGIGPKTASRMILELKGKLPEGQSSPLETNATETVIEGLVGLGFARKDVVRSLTGVSLPSDDAEAIKVGLSIMSSL